MSAEDLDELLRSLHPDCFGTSQGEPDIVVTPTTVDKYSTTADKAAMIQASPPAALVVSLAQLPQLHGFIPRGAAKLNVRSYPEHRNQQAIPRWRRLRCTSARSSHTRQR